MITQTRYTALAVMTLFSCLMVAFLIYIPIIATSNAEYFWNGALFKWCMVLAAIFTGIPILMAFSSMSDRIVLSFFPVRPQSLREQEKIKPALNRVLALYNQKHGSDIDIEVLVMDMPNINGMALGHKTVAISKGLLAVGSDEEIAAVLAHEIGHHHHGDGLLNMTLFVATGPTILIHRVMSWVVENCPKPDMKLGGSNNDSLFDLCLLVLYALAMMFCAVFLWPSMIALWLMRSVDFATAWPIEYRADRFAAELGYAPALIELFERIEDEDVRGATGFLKKYMYSHPPTALRIDRLERMLGVGMQEAA